MQGHLAVVKYLLQQELSTERLLADRKVLNYQLLYTRVRFQIWSLQEENVDPKCLEQMHFCTEIFVNIYPSTKQEVEIVHIT